MSIKEIISEEIARYISREVLNENVSVESGKKKKDGVRRNAIKVIGGKRKDFDPNSSDASSRNISKADSDTISNTLDNDVINVAAVARKLYPKLTPQGAQSKLRKKIKHEKSDSGSIYTLKKNEADMARKIIRKEVEG